MRPGHRRRAALLAALSFSTAAAGLTGCGGAAPDGHTAAGAVAPGPERRPGDNVAPQGAVKFQRLGGPDAAGGSPPSAGTPPTTPDAQTPAGSGPGGGTATPDGIPAPGPGTPPGGHDPTPPGTPDTPGTPGSPGPAPGTTPGGPGAPGGPGTPGSPGTPGAPPGTTPPGTTPPPATTPARLVLTAPTRAPAADRWCERVTVGIANTGSTAARSGTVRFETHIIGALGIDWATVTTAQPLSAPLAGGATRTQTYTVCVESWRVPLGMHVETRKVTADWS
ncbi:hypothetical protein [Streptomyces sp. NPDC090445]|uniref:hypothetical protein n=1 Tax=Streptomyces sp. NPDC090445 TaxID=3365963 RepID=UPI00382B2AE2